MCGIAGLLSTRTIPDLARQLDALSNTLSHRGPDDRGFLTWGNEQPPALGREAAALAGGRLGLVHRRLSIVDLSPLGWQPMGSPNGRHWIVFNGEIYNYPELKSELEAAGETFRSTSDTEVLLAILRRHGFDGLRRLVGMYAFAYLDLEQRRLALVRDPFGIKPLHYSHRNGLFAFASEIKPLIAIGAASARVDRAALFRYLRHAVTNYAGDTVFADVREVLPGTIVELALDDPANFSVRRFWQPAPNNSRKKVRPAEAAEELRSLLIESVALHMRADVPCAAALSGGVDSSGIVTLMRRELGDQRQLDVFSYIADSDRLSERRYVHTVADAVCARVNEVHLDPDALAGEVDDLIVSQEQPFTTTSMWAQAHVFRAARSAGFKIVLDGQGADETMAGYAVFRAPRLEGLLRSKRFGEASAFLKRLPPPRFSAMLQAAGGLLPQPARGLARLTVGKPVVPHWLDGRWFGAAAIEHRPAAIAAASPLNGALQDAVVGSSLPMLLRYADRNAMASSVENRVPFLTTKLVDFAFSLPDEILISRDGVLKRVLRDALRGLVPDVVLDRRDKIGFETPEREWFLRNEKARKLAADTGTMPLPPCLSPSAREAVLQLGEGRVPFSPHLWRIMNVIRWSHRLGVEWEQAGVHREAAA